MYQVMADWGHPASLPSPLDMIYLPPHLPRIFNHGRRFPPGGGGGVLLGILGGGVPQGSSNPDSISDQKM